MILQIIIGALISTLVTFPAKADKIGNGADAIQCVNNSNTSFQLLDLYERDNLWNFTEDLTLRSYADRESILLSRIELLRVFDVCRANLYESWINTFWAESLVIDGVTLTDIQDAGVIFMPQQCQLVQLVVQRRPLFIEDPRYIISGEVFDALTIEGQAAVILHEVIYREAIARGATTSIDTRALTAMLFSRRLSDLSVQQARDLLASLGFPYQEYCNF